MRLPHPIVSPFGCGVVEAMPMPKFEEKVRSGVEVAAVVEVAKYRLLLMARRLQPLFAAIPSTSVSCGAVEVASTRKIPGGRRRTGHDKAAVRNSHAKV